MPSNRERIEAHTSRIEDVVNQIITAGGFVFVDTPQTITGQKTFMETVGIANEDGTVDYLKHINNNFLLSTSTGRNLLNIDEGLNKIYAFNKELAFKDDLIDAGGGTTVIVGDSAVDALYFDSDPQAQINNKVDKVNGKQLSTNDFTTPYKNKLDGLVNYDDTALTNAIATKVNLNGDNLTSTNISAWKSLLSVTDIDSRVKLGIKNVTHNDNTGVFTFTRDNGTSFTVDTLLEKVVTNFTYDDSTQELVLTLEDGSTKKIPMTAFIDDYSGSDGDNITISVSNDNKISAVIKTGTITKEQLTETVQATLNEVGNNSGKIDSILTTWDTKVDKVSGKGLSTNDYTTAEKNKLAGLSNYNDSDVRSLIGTKANANASNLSDDAVSSWKTKLGVVSIEYDESNKTINIVTGG